MGSGERGKAENDERLRVFRWTRTETGRALEIRRAHTSNPSLNHTDKITLSTFENYPPNPTHLAGIDVNSVKLSGKDLTLAKLRSTTP